MRQELRDRWVKALRSGKYKQGMEYLVQGEGNSKAYCCLGVLCDIAPEFGIVGVEDSQGNSFFGVKSDTPLARDLLEQYDSNLESLKTRGQVIEDSILFSLLMGEEMLPQSFLDTFGLNEDIASELAGMNDALIQYGKRNFSYIADHIEKEVAITP